ncbi:MAG: hypothetical protein V7746_07240 [Halioglobus sp.]
MRISTLCLLGHILLLMASVGAWSADDPGSEISRVKLEVMIGEGTVVLEDAGCETRSYVVGTGYSAKTTPSECDAVLTESDVSDAVNSVVQRISSCDPDFREAREAVAELLGELSPAELSMLVAVIINNAHHLCIDDRTIIETIGAIAVANPEAAASTVFVAAILDPDNTKPFTDAAKAAAPDQADNIEQAADTAEQIKEDLNAGAPTTGDPAGPAIVELVEEEAPPEAPAPPPVDTSVPPGGSIPDPPSPE